MATRLYTIEIPLRLAVEAENLAEAKWELRALYQEAMQELPTGAGCFLKDHDLEARLKGLQPS